MRVTGEALETEGKVGVDQAMRRCARSSPSRRAERPTLVPGSERTSGITADALVSRSRSPALRARMNNNNQSPASRPRLDLGHSASTCATAYANTPATSRPTCEITHGRTNLGLVASRDLGPVSKASFN